MNVTALSTRASMKAQHNLKANRAALAETQPSLSIDEPRLASEWLFGRDGYLSARDEQERWITGCSIPQRAAEQILQSLKVSGPVACFLAPTHAAQIRVALDRLAPEQAIIAIVPDARELAMIISCDDFSADIRGHRLWFCIGEAWNTQLSDLLQSHPGLNVPAQFIRMPTTPAEIADPIIQEAQKIFAQVTAERSRQIKQLQTARPTDDAICVIASERFKLWSDWTSSAPALHHTRHVQIDPSDPITSSPLAVARAASKCGAIFTIDTARADSPGLISDELPWLAWIMSPRIPALVPTAPRDHLLVVDAMLQDRAIASGWPADRIHVAGFAAVRAPDTRAPKFISIIENTAPLDAPCELNEFSSHRVLWETLAAELLKEPFVLNDDASIYLERRAASLDIAAGSIDHTRFVRELILPAYAQGIARALLNARLPVKLFGRGWEQIPQFAPHAAGAINTRDELSEIIDQPIALAHVWPWLGAHPMDAMGKPVLRRSDGSIESFICDARKMLNNPQSFMPRLITPALSSDLIHQVLANLRPNS